MSIVQIEKISESHLRIFSTYDIEQEIKDHFTFYAPGYRFSPKFKARIWDGRISLYNLQNKRLPLGLYSRLIDFLDKSNYQYEIKENERFSSAIVQDDIDYQELKQYIDDQNYSLKGPIDEYQYDAIYQSIKNKRITLKAATGAGKSFIIMGISNYLFDSEKRVCIIVPSVNLVNQMYTDFEEYCEKNEFPIEQYFHRLYSGQDKFSKKPGMITTWQSLSALKKKNKVQFYELLNSFDALIVDEAHSSKSNELVSICEGATEVEYKIGTTGTIDQNKISQLTIEGNLGPVYKVVTTKEMIDMGRSAEVDIKAFVLKYPLEECKLVKDYKFDDEKTFVQIHERRNKFLAKLCCSTVGTTVILFDEVVEHAKPFYERVKEMSKRPVYLFVGEVKADKREAIRRIANVEDCVIVASYQTMSTGLNIPNIRYVILGSSSKSFIRIVQTIGRGVRKAEGKEKVVIIDIVDNCKYKSKKNYFLDHFEERLKIYQIEQFPITIKEIDL